MAKPVFATTCSICAAVLYCGVEAVVPALEPTLDCEVAVVGGGWSGVYFAYRFLTGSSVAPEKICLFEESNRIGGRTYSKPIAVGSDHFVLDVGAYRFSPDMHLPGDLILKELQLPTACYEPDCEPANKDFPPPFVFPYTAALRRIVDPVTKLPAGYATALEHMVNALEKKGAHVMLGSKLIDIKPNTFGAELTFDGDKQVRAGIVLLNLPRTPMLSLPSVGTVDDRTKTMLNCTKFDQPKSFFPHQINGKSLTKAYAFYSDAWWHNSLNVTEGQLPSNAFQPLDTSEGIPIGIHFNDGPVICHSVGKGCRGFLEVYYSGTNETFFSDLKNRPENPLGVLNKSMPQGAEKLSKLHSAVMEVTASLFKKRSLPQPTSPPELLVVGVWDRTGKGYTAPTKVYYAESMGDSMAKACNLPGLTEQEYRNSVLKPFGDKQHIYLANNDWVAQEIKGFYGDWAEESLLQAERALRDAGLSKPQWLDADYYEKRIVKSSDAALIV